MKHSQILKSIQQTFIDKWTKTNLRLDSDISVNNSDPYISISYIPLKTYNRFLQNGDSGLEFSGNLRIRIYNKNQTKVLEDIDELLNIFRNKTYGDIKFNGEITTEIKREKEGDLFETFLDMTVCLIH